MIIANIYAPNTNQKCFYQTLMGKLEPYRQNPLLICGVLHPTLDSFNPARKCSTSLSSLLHTEDFYDPCRCLYNTEGDYTFYSHMQKA